MAFTYKKYEESDAVKNARNNMNKYQTYTASDKVNQLESQYNTLKNSKDSTLSPYKTALDTALANINNREAFSYDLNSDALYKQAKEQYIQLGKLAMQDTTAQAAAMTGGYGNSYATTAGNQAYQQYLTQLNDKATDYYSLALDKYEMEGEDLKDKYSLASDRYNTEYNEYQNALAQAQEDYNTERNFDYGQFTDNRTYYTNVYNDESDRDRDIYELGYNIDKDIYDTQTSLDQWQAEFDENQRQYNASLAEEQRQANMDYQLSAQQIAANANTNEYSYEDVVALLQGNTSNAKLFQASILTPNEFKMRGSTTTVNGTSRKYASYNDYVEAVIDKWLKGKDGNVLSKSEAAYLKAYYGIS